MLSLYLSLPIFMYVCMFTFILMLYVCMLAESALVRTFSQTSRTIRFSYTDLHLFHCAALILHIVRVLLVKRAKRFSMGERQLRPCIWNF